MNIFSGFDDVENVAINNNETKEAAPKQTAEPKKKYMTGGSYCCVAGKSLSEALTLHKLTHNMTRDCSLNSQKSTSSRHVVYKYCFECQNKNKRTIFVHNMLSTCIFLGIQ